MWGLPWRPLGDTACRAPRPGGAGTAELVAALRAWPRVRDAVVTDSYVAVYFDPGAPPDDPTPALQQVTATPVAARDHVIDVVYDGPDLDDLAAATGLSRAAVIDAHHRATYVVSFLGFVPGFAYLTGLDERLRVPRRATPRTRVPAGSVAVAGPYAAVYPFASPGGWSLLGTARHFTVWDGERATLQPGDRVHFRCT